MPELSHRVQTFTDSVIRRINQARRQTGDYIPCTGPLSTTTEPGAGS